jgi:RimJ/RimL family protein N-acetyltransferase
VIEAGPFTLRPWERDDTSWLYRAQMEATVTRWGPAVPVGTAVDAARFVDLHARPQPEDGGAWFAITSTDTGELLGGISIAIDHAFRTAEASGWVTRDGREVGAVGAVIERLSRWGVDELELAEVRLVLVGTGDGVEVRTAVEAAGYVADGGAPPADGSTVYVLRP